MRMYRLFFLFVTFVNQKKYRVLTFVLYICNMEIKDRIRLTLETQRLTAAMFADKIGVQRSNVSHVLSGRNKPSFEFLEKLLIAFPKVSAHWLVTGKHPIEQTNHEQSNTSQELDFNEPQLFSDQKPDVDQKEVVKEIVEINREVTIVNKRIVKTLVFYDDFTFDIYLPNEQ